MAKGNRRNQSSNESVVYEQNLTDNLENQSVCQHLNKSVDINFVRKTVVSKGGFASLSCVKCNTLSNNSVLHLCLKCAFSGCFDHLNDHLKTPHSDPHYITLELESIWTVRCYKCDKEIIPEKNKKLKSCLITLKDLYNKNISNPPKVNKNIIKEKSGLKEKMESSLKLNNSTEALSPRGLINLGNTCFFNSVLQCLAQTPFLLEVLLEISKAGEKVVINYNEHHLEAELDDWGPLTETLAETLQEMINGSTTSFSPNCLLDALRQKCRQFIGYNQHDAHELLRQLLDSVKTEDIRRYQVHILHHFGLSKKSNPDDVDEKNRALVKSLNQRLTELVVIRPDQVFKGTLVSTVQCTRCKHTSEVTESFLDLSLPVSFDKQQSSTAKMQSDFLQFPRNAQKTRKGQKLKEKKIPIRQNDLVGKKVPEVKLNDETDTKSKAVVLNKNAKECNNVTGNTPFFIVSNTEEDTAMIQEALEELQTRNLQNFVVTASENGVKDHVFEYDVDVGEEVDEEKKDKHKNTVSKTVRDVDMSSNENNNVKYTPTSDAVFPTVSSSLLSDLQYHYSPDSGGGNGAIIVNNEDDNNNSSNNSTYSSNNGEADESEEDNRNSSDADEENDEEDEDINEYELNEDGLNDYFSENEQITLAPREKFPDLESSIHSCLTQFTDLEILTGNNKVCCESCTERQHKNVPSNEKKKPVYQPATKRLLINSPPPILILHLKRFQGSVFSALRKITKHVSFPLHLDIAQYCSVKCKNLKVPNQKKIIYSLYGVVEHSGSLYGGHYVAYVKSRPPVNANNYRRSFVWKNEPTSLNSAIRPEDVDTELNRKGTWYHISDSCVRQTTEESVLKSQAYLLFYERIV